MMRRILFLAGLASLLMISAVNVMAETAREAFDAIPAQVRAEAEARKKSGSPQGAGQTDPAYLFTFFRNAKEALETGDESSAIQQLRQLQSIVASGPVQDACENVIHKFREERTARDAAASAEMSGLLRRVGEAVVAAKAPKDLDSALRELAAATDKHGPGRATDHNNDLFNTRLQAATRFVARWQDYLLAAGRVEGRQSPDPLQSLAQETETLQLMGIPRSEIIGRLPPPALAAEARESASRRGTPMAEVNAAIDAAFNRLKSLDDLSSAIHDLTVFRDDTTRNPNGYGNNLNDLTAALANLQTLQQAYVEVQAGINRWQTYGFNHFDGSNGTRGESRLTALRAQLIALSLPRLLGAPETEKPAVGERIDTFLDRLLAVARKRGDWQAVATGVECRQMFAPNSAYMGGRSETNAEEVAFKQFSPVKNYERAAQYAQATRAYLDALGSGSQDIPVVLISERLAAIKKDHPANYASGDPASQSSDISETQYHRPRYQKILPPEPSVATPTPTATPATSSPPPLSPSASPAAEPSRGSASPST